MLVYRQTNHGIDRKAVDLAQTDKAVYPIPWALLGRNLRALARAQLPPPGYGLTNLFGQKHPLLAIHQAEQPLVSQA